MAASHKLNNKDKKDLDKFTKYLVYKCIQIIVQSRLGERVKTQSRPYSTGADWFNLVIVDLPEVLSETKKVVSTGTLSSGQNVCVEISLKTTEGESMILETWSLTMTDQKDPYGRIFYTVYNRMGLMLKSLFCVTRATPAYRLSRKQGPETYVMCYRIYNTEPETNLLGSGHESKTVGKVPTPIGTINLSVQYRTKMLISPYSSKELAENLKDDHFKSDSSPKRSHTIPKPCYILNREPRASTTEDGYTLGESEFSASSFSTSPPDQCVYHTQYPIASPQVNRSFPMKPTVTNGVDSGASPTVVKSKQMSNGVNGFHSEGNAVNGVNGNDEEERESDFNDAVHHNGKISLEQIAAFVSDGESDEDDIDGPSDQRESTEIPFVKLVSNMGKMQIDNNANKTESAARRVSNGVHLELNGQHGGVMNRANGNATERVRHASGESTNSASSRTSAADDYVMIDMKCALTEIDDNPELGRFYRECKEAPDLNLFHNQVTHIPKRISQPSPQATTSPRPNTEHLFNSITDQLLQFEAQGHEFDDFVNSLSTAEV